MGIGKLIEEVAGVIVAEEALKKVDPNAGLLEEAAAAVAGFEGGKKLGELLDENGNPKPSAQQGGTGDAGG